MHVFTIAMVLLNGNDNIIFYFLGISIKLQGNPIFSKNGFYFGKMFFGLLNFMRKILEHELGDILHPISLRQMLCLFELIGKLFGHKPILSVSLTYCSVDRKNGRKEIHFKSSIINYIDAN